MNTKADRCPVCASADIRFFATMPDNGHLRRPDVALPVYRCRACDLFFLNPPPPAEIGRAYFARAYAEPAGRLYYEDGFKTQVSEKRLDLVAAHTAGYRLLDIGCGRGHFVHAARARGWDAWGVELDDGACDYARSQLGLTTVLPGTVTSAALTPEPFDVITLWDVIEHVPDPVQCLREAAARLGPSRLLVLRTGNIRSWSFDRHPTRWWAFGSDHRFYFSPSSLAVALRAAGFDVIDVLNCEATARPGSGRRARDIADTALVDGLKAVGRSPAKLAKVGLYWRKVAGRRLGRLRHGPHYHTTIMTVLASKRDRAC